MAELQVETVEKPGALVVKVKGDAGVASVGDLQRQLRNLLSRNDTLVVLDLAELTFISSLGIGALVEYHRAMNRKGGQLKVAAAQPLVHQAFVRSTLTELLAFFDSVEAALGE